MKRLKVLVSAYACSPYQGSEPGMGWGWVKSLGEYHDLWVMCDKIFEDEIENGLKNNPDLRNNLHFYYIPRIRYATLERICSQAYYWTYRKWQQQAYHLAVKLHSEQHFDLVHQLNMIGYREPGYLWKLNVPFVWGPVGGTADVPLRFASVLGLRETFYHAVRNTVNALQLRYHNRVRAALARAAAFVTVNSDTRQIFFRVTGKDSTVIPATTIDAGNDKSYRPDRNVSGRPPLKLLWSGLHLSRKALPIVLEAVSFLPRQSWHLNILGDGPMTKSWKLLAAKLGVDKNCNWHGWLSRRQSMDMMNTTDVFVFPSLQEGTPTVVMEALAMAVPVICLDHCSMSDVVDKDCGIKIPVTTPRRVIQDFAKAIEFLIGNPDELARLSSGALRRAQQFTWQSLAKRMIAVYQVTVDSDRQGNPTNSLCERSMHSEVIPAVVQSGGQ